MSFLDWYLLSVILLLFVGVGSILYTIPLVPPHWKEVYWFGLLCGVILQAALSGALLNRRIPGAVDSQWVVWGLEAAIAMIAALFILVPAVHRWETKGRR